MFSKLCDHIIESPYRSKSNRKKDTISIHCMAGHMTAENCGYWFQHAEASSNYGVDDYGTIGGYVPEELRSWCSSNADNDERAVTIEVASDVYEPCKVTPQAYEGLILLVTDICKRNGIKRLKWSNNRADRVNHRNGCNMTVHRDFDDKSCPGDYLYSRMADIAARVNKNLNPQEEKKVTYADFKKFMEKYEAERAAMPASKWAEEYLAEVKEKGLMVGDSGGKMRPRSHMTREEMAAVLARLAK